MGCPRLWEWDEKMGFFVTLVDCVWIGPGSHNKKKISYQVYHCDHQVDLSNKSVISENLLGSNQFWMNFMVPGSTFFAHTGILGSRRTWFFLVGSRGSTKPQLHPTIYICLWLKIFPPFFRPKNKSHESWHWVKSWIHSRGTMILSHTHGNLRGPPKATPPKKQGPSKALLRETNG